MIKISDITIDYHSLFERKDTIYYTDKLPKTFKGSLLRKEIRQYIKESEGKDA